MGVIEEKVRDWKQEVKLSGSEETGASISSSSKINQRRESNSDDFEITNQHFPKSEPQSGSKDGHRMDRRRESVKDTLDIQSIKNEMELELKKFEIEEKEKLAAEEAMLKQKSVTENGLGNVTGLVLQR